MPFTSLYRLGLACVVLARFVLSSLAMCPPPLMDTLSRPPRAALRTYRKSRTWAFSAQLGRDFFAWCNEGLRQRPMPHRATAQGLVAATRPETVASRTARRDSLRLRCDFLGIALYRMSIVETVPDPPGIRSAGPSSDIGFSWRRFG